MVNIYEYLLEFFQSLCLSWYICCFFSLCWNQWQTATCMQQRNIFKACRKSRLYTSSVPRFLDLSWTVPVLLPTPPAWLQTQNIFLLIVNHLVRSIFVPLVSSFKRCSKPTHYIYFHGVRCLLKPHLAKPSVKVCVLNVYITWCTVFGNEWMDNFSSC